MAQPQAADRAAGEIVDADWPNRETSRYVTSDGIRWHIQRAGRGPLLLLIHGTGASTHSWRDIFPSLIKTHDVIAIDLPGHGFTLGDNRRNLSLPGMADAIHKLLRDEGAEPAGVVGHSAGAAILAHMCITGMIDPENFISINGAFLPFPGMAGALFPALAKLIYLNPLVPRVLAWRADDAENVRRLMSGMGSDIDMRGIHQYARLFRDPRHVRGATRMMAYWNLHELADKLATLTTPTLLLSGTNDRAIPVDTQFDIADRVRSANVQVLKGLGHLAHEEQPDLISQIILDTMQPSSGTPKNIPSVSETHNDTATVSSKPI